MPVRWTVVLAVLIGCLAAAVAQASPPRATSTLIVPGRSIDGAAPASKLTGPLTKFHTAKGIHIGSAAAKVRRA